MVGWTSDSLKGCRLGFQAMHLHALVLQGTAGRLKDCSTPDVCNQPAQTWILSDLPRLPLNQPLRTAALFSDYSSGQRRHLIENRMTCSAIAVLHELSQRTVDPSKLCSVRGTACHGVWGCYAQLLTLPLYSLQCLSHVSISRYHYIKANKDSYADCMHGFFARQQVHRASPPSLLASLRASLASRHASALFILRAVTVHH